VPPSLEWRCYFSTDHTVYVYFFSTFWLDIEVIRKAGITLSAGWQVTLRDPTWHVSSRSGDASC